MAFFKRFRRIRKANVFVSIAILLLISAAIYANSKDFTKDGAKYKRDFRGNITEVEVIKITDPDKKTPRPTRAPITTPLEFEQTNYTEAEERNHIKLNDVTRGSIKPVNCLNGFSDQPERIPDPKIIKFTQQIESHLYSDEEGVFFQDGSFKTINQGERSTRTINYNAICKLNSIYYFLYEGNGPTVKVGGGGSAPSHLAYTDGLGNVVIVEKISRGGDNVLPITSEPDIWPSTWGAPYYGCRQILAANDLELVIRCGGGDGPGGMNSIYVVDLTKQLVIEKTTCGFSSYGEYSTICYNDQGEVYFQDKNSESQ